MTQLHIFSKFGRALAIVAGVAISASAASASLIGQSVTGAVNFGTGTTNYFDPVNGLVPGSTSNSTGTTVTIADPAIEFGVQDTANIDRVDFTADGIVITDDVLIDAFNWTMTFVSSAFTGLTLTEVSDGFSDGGVTGTLTGDTLVFTWAGTSQYTGLMSAQYSLVSAVPLPAGGVLLLTGAAALGFAGRRRRRKS